MSENLPIDPDDLQMEKTDLSSCEARLVISVPPRLAKRFCKKLKKSGAESSSDATTQQLQHFCIEQSLKRFDISPIWGPIQTPQSNTPQYREGNEFILSIDVDVPPEIDWPEFSTFEIIRPIREITTAMIDSEMTEQQRDAGKKTPLASTLQIGDEVSCKVTLLEDGSDAPLYTQEKATIRIPDASGSASIFEIPVVDVATKLLNCSIGDTLSIETIAPDEYNDPTLRNRPVTIELTLLEAYRIEPTTVEAVIEQYGSPNETILRQQIKTALEGKVSRDQQDAISHQVFSKLADTIEIPLPNRVCTMFRDSITETVRTAMEQRGCSVVAINQRLSEQSEQIEKIARVYATKRATSNLLGRHFKMQVDEQAIIAEIAEMAAVQGRRPEDLRSEIMAHGKLQSVAIAVIEKKCIKLILEQVTLTDMPAQEWIETRKTTV